jgi:hypothetical protein
MAASERGGLHQQSQRRALLGLRRQSVLRVGQTTKPTLKRIVEIAFFLFTTPRGRAGGLGWIQVQFQIIIRA